MIQVVTRALDILEVLGAEPRGMTVIALAARLELNRATCANIVRTLVARGYLLKEAAGPNYLLGPRAYGLTRRRCFLNEMVVGARAEIDTLAAASECSTVLAVIYQLRCYMIYAVRHELGTPPDEDAVLVDDISEKATGRLLLAQAGPEDRRDFLAANPETAARWDEDDVTAAVPQVRQAGYTESRHGHLLGLAVPVRARQRVVAALGIYLPARACPAKRRRELVAQMHPSAERIGAVYATHDSCPAGLLQPEENPTL